MLLTICRIISVIILFLGLINSIYNEEKQWRDLVPYSLIRLTHQSTEIFSFVAFGALILTVYRKSAISRLKFMNIQTEARYNLKSLSIQIVMLSNILDIIFYNTIFNWQVYKYILLRDILNTVNCLVIDRLMYLLRNVSNAFIDLNVILENNTNTVRYVTIRHNRISDYVEKFNSTFAPFLILSIIYFILGILISIMTVTEYSIRKTKVKGYDVEIWVLVVYLATLIMYAVISVRLALAGRRIEVAIIKTKTICFNRINSSNNSQVQAELLQLNEQIKSRNISVNTAGCFEINLQLIGFIYSALTTLTVYAIEFLLFYSK